MSKYIVDIDDFEPMFKVDSIGVFGIGKSVTDNTENHSWSRIKSLVDFEELNSDYINEHYGVMQDEAYQRGLDDAWEAAKKIVCDDELDWNTLLHIFNRSNFEGIFGDFSPSEAIDKLKSYKEKQKADDEIDVGDEVDWSGDKFIVTRIFQPHNKAEECDGVDMDGCTYHDVIMSGLTKTGRHVDITDMLKGALE